MYNNGLGIFMFSFKAIDYYSMKNYVKLLNFFSYMCFIYAYMPLNYIYTKFIGMKRIYKKNAV